MSHAMNYRKMPVPAGLLTAAQRARARRAALTASQRPSVTAWEAEGGALVAQVPKLK